MERSIIAACDRTALLMLARSAIEAALAGRAAPPIPEIAAAREHHGAFVSLHELNPPGDLRGCIGHVSSDRPLGEVIRQVAVSAARSDPRFAPVTSDELPGLRIEISVLSEPLPVAIAERDRLVLGRDGVQVRCGRAHAVLLPQVATEQGFDAAAFLNAVCRKAGLAAGSWREPATEVFTFTADIFVE